MHTRLLSVCRKSLLLSFDLICLYTVIKANTSSFLPATEPMHDNGTQTIKAEVVEPIIEPQEVCREEANASSSHSPSPRTVYTFTDGKVSASLAPFHHTEVIDWLLLSFILLPQEAVDSGPVYICFG